MFDVLAFDADDTLWHQLTVFNMTERRFRDLIAPYGVPHERLETAMLETERRNLRFFGYGVKGFLLSMIETAIELTDGRVTGHDIQKLIDLARGMLTHPIEVLEGVAETLAALKPHHRLWVITKGDLFDQESKVARSGLADYFERVEVVPEKDRDTYARLLAREGLSPERFVMIGNSLKSDILPVLEMGGHAIHVPYPLVWALETVDPERLKDHHFHAIDRLADLPALIAQLEATH